MPTLRSPVSGSRVITCGSVMKGPPSCGQVVSTGMVARSGSLLDDLLDRPVARRASA